MEAHRHAICVCRTTALRKRISWLFATRSRTVTTLLGAEGSGNIPWATSNNFALATAVLPSCTASRERASCCFCARRSNSALALSRSFDALAVATALHRAPSYRKQRGSGVPLYRQTLIPGRSSSLLNLFCADAVHIYPYSRQDKQCGLAAPPYLSRALRSCSDWVLTRSSSASASARTIAFGAQARLGKQHRPSATKQPTGNRPTPGINRQHTRIRACAVYAYARTTCRSSIQYTVLEVLQY